MCFKTFFGTKKPDFRKENRAIKNGGNYKPFIQFVIVLKTSALNGSLCNS